MHHLKLSLRLAALGIILGVVGFMALSPVRTASAVFTGTSGVICLDVYIDNDPQTVLGSPPGAEDARGVIIGNRLDPVGSTWKVSAISYQGMNSGTQPPTGNDARCEVNDDGNTTNGAYAGAAPNGMVSGIALEPPPFNRPVAIASLSGSDLVWTICSETNILGTDFFVLTSFTVRLTGASFAAGTTYYGKQVAYLDTVQCTTTPQGPPNGATFNLALVARYRPPNTGAPTGGDADDWDGDGRTDFDEMTSASVGRGDMFNKNDANLAVGGIAELPDEQQALPLDAKNESGTNMALIAGGVAAAITLVMVSAGSTALYVRRRTNK